MGPSPAPRALPPPRRGEICSGGEVGIGGRTQRPLACRLARATNGRGAPRGSAQNLLELVGAETPKASQIHENDR